MIRSVVRRVDRRLLRTDVVRPNWNAGMANSFRDETASGKKIDEGGLVCFQWFRRTAFLKKSNARSIPKKWHGKSRRSPEQLEEGVEVIPA
jgi:hypothetical protein